MAGTKIRLDMTALTLGDLEDFEEYVGEALTDVMTEKPVIDPETGKPVRENGRIVREVQLSAKSLTGIVWIVGRKDNPAMTAQDARAIRVDELELIESEDESPSAKKDDEPGESA